MKKLWMLLAGAALVMSACSDDNTENVVPVPEDGLTTLSEISAVLPESRTSLEDHEFEVGKTIKTLWSDGDCISVWSLEQPNPVLFRLEGAGGSSTGTFRAVGESTVRGTKFYALYNGDQTNATKTVTLGGTQAQEGDGVCNIASGIAPMAAYTEGVAPDYAEAFTFQNLCGIMALSLTADADVRLAKLNFVGGNNLSGSGTVTFSGDKASLVLNSATSTSLTRDCSIDMVKGEMYTVYVVVPAGEYLYLSVDAYISSDPTKPVLSRRRQGSNAAFTINTGGITRVANFNVKTVAPHVYAVGDVYPIEAAGTTNVKGIVFEAAQDGQSGKIVALKDCQNNADGSKTDDIGTYYWYSWGASSAGLNSTSNGKSNTDAVRGNSDYPAFVAVTALGDEWYLPARDELSKLFDIQGTILGARGFEEMIGVAYWSSTVSGSSRAKKIDYYDATVGNMATVALSQQSTVQGSVRAIAQF